MLAIGTAIIRRQHPGNQEPKVAGTQQAEVPVVVDVAEILVLHGAASSLTPDGYNRSGLVAIDMDVVASSLTPDGYNLTPRTQKEC